MKLLQVFLTLGLFATLYNPAVAQNQENFKRIEAGYHVCDLGDKCQYFRADNQSKYINGKELFKRGKYRLAMEEFKPLIRASEPNPFTTYAMYFYALSAYKLNELHVARDMFLQLKNRFPKWEQLEEVDYWLGNIYFEMNQPEMAEKYLVLLQEDEIKQDARLLKFHFLYEEKLDSLKGLLETYPQDRDLAEIIAFKIVSQPLGAQDHVYLQYVLNNYKLDASEYNIFKEQESVMKDTYQVAVLMPFLVDELLPVRRSRSNQFVLDIYQGMELAESDLSVEDIQVKLYAYDTKKDLHTTADVLDLPEMKGMDLLVGPLYPGPSQVATDFSFENRVNMVNPLSSNPAIIKRNPYSFLFMPTYETQAKEAARFASEKFENKVAMIVYGKNERDSVWAANYKEMLEADSFNVVAMLAYDKENSRDLITMLNAEVEEEDEVVAIDEDDEKEEEEVELVIPTDSIGHIFVASTQQLVIASAVSGVEMRGDRIPLIIHENWLNTRLASYEQLERLDVYLMAPTYIDYSKKQVENFKKAYYRKYKELPSHYSYIGYDMMMFYGKMMYLYGTHFQNKFSEMGLYYPHFFMGIEYDNAQDNQYVPIISFEEGEIKHVNRGVGKGMY